MPKLYEYLGYVFFFYSNDHLPVHCHVEKGGVEMKVELTYVGKDLHIRFFKFNRGNFNATQKKEIESFVRAYHRDIDKKWHLFFREGKRITCKKIAKRIT